VVAGAMAPRKGIDLLAAASEVREWPTVVRFVGTVAPPFRDYVESCIIRVRGAGAQVELCEGLRSADYLRTIGEASCSVIPYPRHIGMSRVLLESATMGTPVVAHNWGLLGHLVKTHNIGLAVDCRDRSSFRDALDRMSDAASRDEYSTALAQFAAPYSGAEFARRLRIVWTDMAR